MRLTQRPERCTLPVNLIIGESPALVVGGGKVGERKVKGLLESGAAVALVCPEATAELAALAAAGRIEWHRRPYEKADAAGRLAVFACTDDKHVNRAVLEDCRAVGTLCGCADGNWADGDFTTPAVARLGAATVAVSTSGSSCRGARDLRDEIAKTFSGGGEADIVVIGTSDAQLPSRRRAQFHLPPEERVRAGAMLRQVRGVREFMIINTCNRIEIVASCSPDPDVEALLKRIAGFDRLDGHEYFLYRSFEAFRHLVRVVSGLESSLLGESHVVAQFKEALAESVERGWAGPLVRGFADETMRVAKLVRHEVGGLIPVAEIDQVAFRYLSVHGGLDAASKVCVIGTGAVGTGVAAALAGKGVGVISVYHRNESSALKAMGAESVQLAKLESALARADAVVSAVDSSRPVVTPAMVESLAGRGVLAVDLGVPRNIDPFYDECARGITVVDLDDLKLWHRVRSGVLDRVFSIADGVIGREYKPTKENQK